MNVMLCFRVRLRRLRCLRVRSHGSAGFVCVHDSIAGFVYALDMLRKARTYAVCSATHVTYFLIIP